MAKRRWVTLILGLFGLVAAMIVTGWLSLRPLPNGCDFHIHVALSGKASQLNAYIDRECAGLALGDARAALGWDFLFIISYALFLGFAINGLWPHAWRSSLFGDPNKKKAVVLLPVAAGVFDLLENASAWLFLRDSGGVRITETGALITSTIGWWKWALVVVAVMAFLLALAGALGNLTTPRATRSPQAPEPFRPLSGTGICLSGGGIRSASFSLGGLRGLDRAGLFRPARWLSAVSGGAYTAGAWMIARAATEEASLVQPQPTEQQDRLFDPNLGEETPRRYDYIRRFRTYMSTGRGGLPVAVLTTFFYLILQLALLGVMLYLASYPLGWLTSTWAIRPKLAEFDYMGVFEQEIKHPFHLWLPGGLVALVGGACWIVSLACWDPLRKRLMKIAISLMGAGAVMLILLIGLPWALEEAPRLLAQLAQRLPTEGGDTSDGATILSILSALGLTGALMRIAAKPLARQAPRLGGVLLALLAIIVGGKIAADAAFEEGFFYSEWYWGVALGFGIVYFFANPQVWSLHTLYHLRLRTTFATTQDEENRVKGAPFVAHVYPISQAAERSWQDYQSRTGPELLICCAVQMKGNDVTEIPALSFTFSADTIGYNEILWNADRTATNISSYAVPAADYVAALGSNRRVGRPVLGSVSAGVAISGAAFTSAMGRQSLGTSNALLAVFNLRLGVWMPNPRCVTETHAQSLFKKPRLNYLVKEILGVYDLNDPYVYVTDGGHWENLGLVELVRRRAKYIFCIDASGDAPGSFATLREAISLARFECNAEIDIDLSRLATPPGGGLPADAVAVGIVRYHSGEGYGPDSCPLGILFYAKATIGKDAPVAVQSFGLKDKIFPRYPTYDQFLREGEFDNLVALGDWAATRAAKLYEQLVNALTEDFLDEDKPSLKSVFDEIIDWQYRTEEDWLGTKPTTV